MNKWSKIFIGVVIILFIILSFISGFSMAKGYYEGESDYFKGLSLKSCNLINNQSELINKQTELLSLCFNDNTEKTKSEYLNCTILEGI